MEERVALFAGSFDPFTGGHMDVVRKCARMFDRVVVMIGVNVRKQRRFPAERMRDAIAEALAEAGVENAEAVVYDGLVADYCREHGVGWYVRGLRSAADYAYEEENAQVNRMLCPELETIYLRADRPALSSSVVAELMRFGRSPAEYVPPAVMRAMEETC